MPTTTSELIQTLAFYGLSAVAVGAALVVVSSRRILRAAVALTVALVSSAGFYILLGYDFIAGVQLLVYVGGIVILIIYAVMLTSSLEILEDHPTPMRMILGVIGSLAFLAVTFGALVATKFPIQTGVAPPQNIAAEVGRKLLDTGISGFVLPFEIISLLLLSAAIGGIVVARSYKSQKEERDTGTLETSDTNLPLERKPVA